MIILGLILLLSLALCVWLVFIDGTIAETVIGKIVAGFLLFPLLVALAFFVSVLAAGIFSLPTLAMKTEIIQEEPVLIYSIKDNAGVSGNFVLGSGSVKSELLYYFVIETEYGKKIDSVKANNSYIVESDEIYPRIVKETTRLKSAIWSKVLLDMNNIFAEGKYIITVPTNTVTEEFIIDLQ